MKRPWLICLLLALAIIVVYCRVLGCDFVDYDDPAYITSNQEIQRGLNTASVHWAFTTGAASNWHPLTWLSHIVDIQLFGLKPAGHHLTNLLLHVANSLLLFLILHRLTRELWPSATVTALFALHPLRVESVAWISERKDVLSTLFWMLAVMAYVRWAQPSPASNAEPAPAKPAAAKPPRSRLLFYILSLASFALGLMAKPMVVTLPFVLLLLDFWPLGRLRIETKPRLAAIAPLFLEKTPFFVLSIASCAVTFLVQRRGGAVSTSLPLSARLENAMVSYARYLGKTFWPARLSVLYPHPGYWPALAFAASLVLIVSITALVLWRARRQPYLLFGWLWFLGILAPSIGLVQVGLQSMADRYSYVPSVGIFVMLVWGLNEWFKSHAFRGPFRAAVATAPIIACAMLTIHQIGYWHDSETLFQHAVEVTDKNYLAYNNLGFYLSNKGEKARAKQYFEDSLKINPNYDEAHNNLGFALAGEGHYAEAISEYEAALRLNPLLTEAHNNYGNALASVGRFDDAVREYLTALQENPHHAEAHNNLGNALAQHGRLDEAIEQFRCAIRDKDNYLGAHSNLGNAFAMQGKFDQAIEQYRLALQLDPDDPQTHNNLANVLAQQGKFDEAIGHYSLAIKLKPDNPDAHVNLAYCFVKKGNRAEAEAQYVEALRERPDYPQARQQLAALRAQNHP